jgi:hypothetical protein
MRQCAIHEEWLASLIKLVTLVGLAIIPRTRDRLDIAYTNDKFAQLSFCVYLRHPQPRLVRHIQMLHVRAYDALVQLPRGGASQE